MGEDPLIKYMNGRSNGKSNGRRKEKDNGKSNGRRKEKDNGKSNGRRKEKNNGKSNAKEEVKEKVKDKVMNRYGYRKGRMQNNMEVGTTLRVIMIVTGVFLFGVTLSSLARRKMTEPFCLTWGLVSLMIILAGVLLRPVVWNKYISDIGMMIVLIIGFCLIYGAYFMSVKISELMRKNQELSMQVSLLNQEMYQVRQYMQELEDTGK